MSKPIVTISRQFGSGGRIIGKQLAEELGVVYYDKNILDDIAKDKGYSKELIEEDEKKAKNSFFYSMANAFGSAGYGVENLSINEQFFMAQFDYITKIGQKQEGGVIVGRCADYVLREDKSVSNIFIYADEDSRIERAIEIYGVSPEEAPRMLADVDKARANYYRYHTGQKWGEPSNYHLAIDSGHMEIDNIVKLILEYITLRRK
ncbi:MAG: AAA family ATPase [Anaerovoracaceae bacterium]|jgi:cytidylate kinase